MPFGVMWQRSNSMDELCREENSLQGGELLMLKSIFLVKIEAMMDS